MEIEKERRISAGSFDLNKFLYGGYEKDIITTIYGGAGSGKTNLCVLASVSQAKKNKKVIFIDTEQGFSVERFKQICGEDWEKFLKNIILLKPASFSEQEESFGKLLKEIKTDSDIGLIVVDGMTMLYRLELAEARKDKDERKIDEINSELAKMLRVLSEIARTRNIPVIITNQVYSEFLSEDDLKKGREKENLMVGGSILAYWSKCLIELKSERGRRKMILRKHRSLPEKTLDFEIINSGVRKRGWI
ncbi:MAG: DNA repair and recombination protein RadB [Nanoarchaeota archaeon]|nr:DNA repair and recombination protein RadB [Nanoarchaeota archaeon]MBU4086176.1 DNA repair and recombination protein RadB [Nanoarchaeota archaeon]